MEVASSVPTEILLVDAVSMVPTNVQACTSLANSGSSITQGFENEGVRRSGYDATRLSTDPVTVDLDNTLDMRLVESTQETSSTCGVGFNLLWNSNGNMELGETDTPRGVALIPASFGSDQSIYGSHAFVMTNSYSPDQTLATLELQFEAIDTSSWRASIHSQQLPCWGLGRV